jgi:hypothetical protein
MTRKSKKDVSHNLLVKACKAGDLREVIFQLKNGVKLNQDYYYPSFSTGNVVKFFIKNVEKHLLLYFDDYQSEKSYLREVTRICVKICTDSKNFELLEELYNKRCTRNSWVLEAGIKYDSLETVKIAINNHANTEFLFNWCATYGRIKIFEYMYKFIDIQRIDSVPMTAYFNKQMEFLDYYCKKIEINIADQQFNQPHKYIPKYFEHIAKKIFNRPQEIRKIKMLTLPNEILLLISTF